MKKYLWLSPVILALLIFSGCGGSGGGSSASGDVTGMEIASQISIVNAQGEGTASVSLGSKSLGLKALTTDEETDYYTDRVDLWVYDDSMQTLELINEILCSIKQTKHTAMVNQGNYLALIDMSLCQKGDSQESNQGNQTTGADETNFEKWIVNASRASSGAPEVVKVWITEKEGPMEMDMGISVKATIYEGITNSNPVGKFRLDFKMAIDEIGEFGQGYLKTVDRSDGLVELELSMASTEYGMPMNQAVHIIMDPSDDSGYGYASHSYGFEDGEEYNVAFNPEHYKGIDVDTEEVRCLDRKNFTNHAFRYGVYNEDGSRVENSNSGFGIRYITDEEVYYGYASYHGIWIPDEVNLVTGLEVVGENDASEYTTFVTPGKLVAHTRDEITLGDIKNALLFYWDNESENHYRVFWDGSDFIVDSLENCSEGNGCTWTDMADAPLNLSEGQWYGFWREGLGNLFFEAPATLSDNTVAEIDSYDILTRGSDTLSNGEITLHCYVQCLKPNLTEAQMNWYNGETPYFDDEVSIVDPYVYTFDPEDMILRYGGEPVVIAEGVEVSGSNEWGIHSGPMLLPGSGIENVYESWGISNNFTWETGSNHWNKLTNLVDDNGDIVEFDEPMRLLYEHSTGIKYILEYMGEGELHGIPWNQVEGTNRWYPEITIPDGSELLGEEDEIYYVKAIEIEQQMNLVDEALCSDLEYQELDMPDGDYVDPNIGTRPTVTDAPAVIGGVLQ